MGSSCTVIQSTGHRSSQCSAQSHDTQRSSFSLLTALNISIPMGQEHGLFQPLDPPSENSSRGLQTKFSSSGGSRASSSNGRPTSLERTELFLDASDRPVGAERSVGPLPLSRDEFIDQWSRDLVLPGTDGLRRVGSSGRLQLTSPNASTDGRRYSGGRNPLNLSGRSLNVKWPRAAPKTVDISNESFGAKILSF